MRSGTRTLALVASLVAVAGTALVVATSPGRSIADASGPGPERSGAPEASGPPPEPAPPSTLLFDAPPPRASLAPAPRPAEEPPPPEVDAPDPRVEALVARLEQLARDGSRSFHPRALPVVGALRRVVAEAGHEATALLDRTGGTALTDRTRGAIFLAIAPLLEADEFLARFRGWLIDPASSAELARAATLAAEARGRTIACDQGIDLDRFRSLPMAEGVAELELYPVRLERAPEDGAAEVLIEVLASAHPRLEGLSVASTDADALDVVTTRDLQRLVLSLRALEDPAAWQLTFGDLRPDELPRGPALLTIRSAFFAARSLAPCDDDLDALVGAWRESDDPIVSALAGMMDRVGGGAEAPTLRAVRALRGGTRATDHAELMLALDELGRDVADRLGDPDAEPTRRAAIELMSAIALDADEGAVARQAAIRGLSRARAWTRVCDVAEAILVLDGDPDLRLAAASEVAQVDPSARERAEEVLELALAGDLSPSLRARITRTLASLRERMAAEGSG